MFPESITVHKQSFVNKFCNSHHFPAPQIPARLWRGDISQGSWEESSDNTGDRRATYTQLCADSIKFTPNRNLKRVLTDTLTNSRLWSRWSDAAWRFTTDADRGMEIMDSGEPFLQWDKNLSELSESGENDILYSTVSRNLLIIPWHHCHLHLHHHSICFDVLQLVSNHPQCLSLNLII